MSSQIHFKSFRRTNTPPSPLHCPIPSSPTMRAKMTNIPSIATTSTPPSSPAMQHTTMIAVQQQSPILRRAGMQLNLSSTIAPTLTLNEPRTQPIASARSPVCPMKATKPPMRRSGKRNLGPGCSMLDWIRLCRTTKDMAGNGGTPRPVTLSELAKHNTEDDAWTAVKGKVYNITPYFKFHPGSKEDLMKGAGIDCTILFDEAHQWVIAENTLRACYVGPLVENSPTTQRRNSANLVRSARRKDSTNLIVPKTVKLTDGVNTPAVASIAIAPAIRDTSHLTDIIPRKNSMELRKETEAAVANEEPDGSRQVSPESPIRPIVVETVRQKTSTASQEAAENTSIRLRLPPQRIRRISEPHPQFSWVQSEKAVIIHVVTQNKTLKTTDVVLDVNETAFEAAIFINDWVFELKIALTHKVVGTQVAINCGRVEISLKKDVAHQQWEEIGSYLKGHAQLVQKKKREMKYHSSRVESIKTITHDTKVFNLRLPSGSYLNVPVGHHLSIKADINGEEVERSYTPVSSLEISQRQDQQEPEGEMIELMIKLYKDGKMSGFLSNLKIGDKVMLSDPEGTFDAASKLTPATDILLIAAGSGFTPMVKIMREFALTETVSRQRITSLSEATGESSEENQLAPELAPQEACECTDGSVVASTAPKTAKLLFANKKAKDIMCKEEMDDLQQSTGGRFSVTHILSNADNTWGGMRGRINETLIQDNLPAVKQGEQKNALVCICGPEPFTSYIINTLVEMDYPDECIHIFQ